MPNVADDAISYLTSGITAATTLLNVEDASVYPDPVAADDEVWIGLWEISKYRHPMDDPNRERLEMTARDTGADTITVVRGTIDTAQAHNTAGASYAVAVLVDKQNLGRVVIRIESGAPDDSIRVKADGKIGIGATAPASTVQISAAGAGVRVKDTAGAAEAPHIILEGSGSDHLGRIEALEDSTDFRLYGRAGVSCRLGSNNVAGVVILQGDCTKEQLRCRPSGVMTDCPSSQAANGDLKASQLHFSVDEVGNNLQIKVKYADGTTVKTATVALA